MLKINSGSLKEGIKQLAKVKAKESHINLYSAGKGKAVYLTKVCLDGEYVPVIKQIAAYKLAGEASCGFNRELLDTAVKALTKINETNVEIDSVNDKLISVVTKKRSINLAAGARKVKKDIVPEYLFNGDMLDHNAYESVLIDGAEMLTMLQVTDYVCLDEVRPILQGVHFTKSEVAALDGYRLAIRECSTMNLKREYTVHGDVLKVVGSLIKKDTKVQIDFNEKQVKIQLGDLSLYSDLLPANYINYESLIKYDTKVTASYDVAELKEEIGFLLSLAINSKQGNIVQFNLENKKVAIKSSNVEASSTIKLDKAKAKGDLAIAFNTNYIEAMLKHFSGAITCEYTTRVNPMVVRSEDIKGLDLILPVRMIVEK